MKKTTLLLIFTSFLFACNWMGNKQEAEKQLKAQIKGDWEWIREAYTYSGNDSVPPPPPPPFSMPQGMTFSNDSIESYLGFYKKDTDRVTGNRHSTYIGDKASYKISDGDIFIKNLFSGKWEFEWRFVKRRNDTLELAVNDSVILKYKRLQPILEEFPDFDQIIYSSSGCYGACEMMDVSVDKEGNVLFQARGFVKPLGIFSAKLDDQTRKNLFDHFRKANPMGLSYEYAVHHTDDETITTTYIKNGKIVKTIYDYGMAGPSRLVWAYMQIARVYHKIKLKSLLDERDFHLKIYRLDFNKNALTLSLKESESFYLWTELVKAQKTSKTFQPKYRLTFSDEYYYWTAEQKKHKAEIKKVSTDGRYFKFELKNGEPITLDLGYDFVARNFKSGDFKSDAK